MADRLVQHANGRHGLGGSRDTDLEGLDPSQHDVFAEDTKLAEAQSRFPSHDWFTSYTVKDKRGNAVNVRHTVTFNRPPAGKKVFYYFNGEAVALDHTDAPNKGNQQRSKVTVPVGDPPIGLT